MGMPILKATVALLAALTDGTADWRGVTRPMEGTDPLPFDDGEVSLSTRHRWAPPFDL
jgi:hypothetical protein